MPNKKSRKPLTRNQKILIYTICGIAIFALSILITNIVISNLTSTTNANDVNATGNSVVGNDVVNEVENVIENNTVANETANEVVENTTNTTNTTSTSNTSGDYKEKMLSKYSSSPYYIKINKKCNVVTIYKKDSEGKYTVPFKAMLCSTGTYTPPNNLKGSTYSKSIYAKEDWYRRWGTLQGHNGYANVYGQYASGIVDNVLFHSVTYTSKSPDSLEWEEFNKLGTSASAGCVRLCVRDVKWIYENVPANTLVEFYEDSNPGPLGKPTLPKISASDPNRNWDPTDPDPNNPWNKKTETPKQETKTVDNKNTTNTSNSTK